MSIRIGILEGVKGYAPCLCTKLRNLILLLVLFCLLVTEVGLTTYWHSLFNTETKVGEGRDTNGPHGTIVSESGCFCVFAFFYLTNPFFIVTIWHINF